MPVMVNVMDSQNFLALIKSTSLTFLKHPSSEHVLSDRAKDCFPCNFRLFSNTFFGAENSFFRRSIEKNFTAMSARKFYLLIIGCLDSLDFGKSDRFPLCFCQMPQAFSRTRNSTILSVRKYLKRITTIFAKESDHAT